MKKIIFIILSLLLVACSSDNKKESLTLFTWEGMFPQEVLDDFTKETGIKINYANFDYDETMLTKLQENNAKDYDLVLADDYIIELAIKNDLVLKLDKEKIKNYKNVNEIYLNQFFDPTNEYTLPYGAGIPLIVYDPSINQEINSYKDLWNPEFKDDIALLGNYRVIDGIALKTLGYSFNTNDLDEINKAKDELLLLRPNIRVIDDSNLQDYLISGEVKIAFMYTSQVNAALSANPELKVAYPSEGLGFGIMATFIPKNSSNTDNAYKFLDYINRPDVAAKSFEYTGYFTTNKASEEFVSDEFKNKIILPSDKYDIFKKGEMIQNISDEANQLHTEVFNLFKTSSN